MNRHKLIRMLLEQAGAPAHAGSAGTPAPTADPTPAAGNGGADTPPAGGQSAPGDNNPPAESNPDKGTDNQPAGTNGKADTKHSLLGGAKADDGKKPGTDGSAEPNPDGGKKQPGDGQQEQPQDPYKDLSLPGGVAVNEAELAKYKDLAKTMNLKAEDAQRILDFEAERLSAGAAAAAAAWQEQVKQEHGDKLPIVMATCAKAIDKLGGDELRTLLDQTGLGNHPLMVKAFFQAGSLLKEDKQVNSNGSAKGDVTFTQALYGKRSN